MERLLACSDNMAAVQRMQEGTLTYRPHNVLDIVVTHVHSLSQPVEWVWVQAQHDTGDRDPIACPRRRGTKGGEWGGTQWEVAQVWMGDSAVFLTHCNKPVANPKKYLQQQDTPHLKVYRAQESKPQ